MSKQVLQVLLGLAAAAALIAPLPAASQVVTVAATADSDVSGVGMSGMSGGAKPQIERPRRLKDVRSWAYQLQKADPREIAASPFDLVVIDLTRNGDAERPLKPSDLARMKKKPDGKRRIVLAYVSIGEAEDYRFYWNEEWTETPTPEVLAEAEAAERAAAGLPPIDPAAAPPAPPAQSEKPAKPVRWITEKAPSWLGDENESWSGNFAVKYWEQGWQDLIFGAPNSYLDRVIAAGFDGIYLDRVDAHYEYMHERPADAEMADFVVRLAAAARAKRPDFIVVPQNGEELLLRPSYLAAIDGIAKEDLFFGHPSEGAANPPAQITNSLNWLKPAGEAGLAVFVIEYLDAKGVMEAARDELESRGFIGYFGPRTLDRLVPQPTVKATFASGEAGSPGKPAGTKSNGSKPNGTKKRRSRDP